MIKKITSKQKEKNKKKSEETKKLHDWFLKLWDETEETQNEFKYVRCYETGVILSRDNFRENTCCYSHILPKSKYPELAMVEENVVIVHPSAHDQYEIDMDKTPKQKSLRLKLKEKYDSNNKEGILE